MSVDDARIALCRRNAVSEGGLFVAIISTARHSERSGPCQDAPRHLLAGAVSSCGPDHCNSGRINSAVAQFGSLVYTTCQVYHKRKLACGPGRCFTRGRVGSRSRPIAVHCTCTSNVSLPTAQHCSLVLRHCRTCLGPINGKRRSLPAVGQTSSYREITCAAASAFIHLAALSARGDRHLLREPPDRDPQALPCRRREA